MDRAGVGGAVVAAADRVEGTVREPFHIGSLWLVRPDGYVSVVAGDARPIRDYLGGLRGRGAGEPDVPHEACRGRATVDLQITTSH